MKIGMNLLLYTTNPNDSTLLIADRYQAMGFDGLEWPLLGTEKKMCEKIGAYNRKTGLGATAVYAFGPGTNPISADKSERDAGLTTIKDRIEAAELCGATHLCGPIVQTLGHFTGKPRTDQEWSWCVDYLKAAGDHAARHNLTLVVEYLNRFEMYFLNTAADANKLCDAVNHPNVQTMVDSFHANIEEKSMSGAIKAARPHLAHIHISENDRGIPGSGTTLNWADFFKGIKEVNYDGWLVIESFAESLPDLAAAAKIWRKLFDSQDEVGRQGLAFIKKMLA